MFMQVQPAPLDLRVKQPAPELQVPLELPVQLDPLESKDCLDLTPELSVVSRGRVDHRALRVSLDSQDHRVRQVITGVQVVKVLRASQAARVTQDHKVLQE